MYEFEWLVVDDGSEDNTQEVVEKMIRSCDRFSIRYIRKENGGRHTAINVGLREAKGEIFFLLDSDDWLPSDAMSKTKACFESIRGMEGFAGIVGWKCFEDGRVVGTTFEGEYRDFDFFDRKKMGVSGDRAEVFYTEVFRQFPFPEIPGEKFLSERMNWYRIADAGYRMRWFNTNLYFCEYQPDGLSAGRGTLRKSMGALRLSTKELVRYRKVPIKEKAMFIGRYALLRHYEGATTAAVAKELEVVRPVIFALRLLAKLYEKQVYNKG